jgi:hypothetical protein
MLGLLAGLGLAILVSGGWLAHATNQGNHNLQFAEPVAGLLIIAGLGCIGTSLGLCFGALLN